MPWRTNSSFEINLCWKLFDKLWNEAFDKILRNSQNSLQRHV